MLSFGVYISFLQPIVDAESEAVFYNIRPASLKHYTIPHRSRYSVGYLNSDFQFKQKYPTYMKPAAVPSDDVFRIEAADAIDVMKYSQPDIAYSLLSENAGVKVPSSTLLKHKLLQTSAQNPRPSNFQEEAFPIHHTSEKDPLKPMRDIRYLNSAVDEGTHISVTGDESNYKLGDKNLKNVLQTHSDDVETTNLYMQTKNNFTDASDNLVSVSSDAVLSYEVPATEFNDSSNKNSSVKQSTDIVSNVPSPNNSDFETLLPESKIIPPGYTTQNYVELNTHVYIDYINQTNLTDSSIPTSIFPSINNDENVTNSLPSTDSEKKLSSGTVAGIVIAVLVSVTLLSSAVIYLLYRKFNGKCTSVVESKFNTDNCGYLDDSLRSSIYLNNHIELPKESSEEMTSLDNDSFLNSLETMTIQNYWADNSKNTKV